MDSLVASYGSSDEEEEHREQHHHVGIPSSNITSTSSFSFSSLHQPKSSSSSSSGNPKTSLFFSSLPQPKSNASNPPQILTNRELSSSDGDLLTNRISKRVVVVQLKKLLNPTTSNDDDDADDELTQRRRRKEPPSDSSSPSSVKSFLSTIPAPKNSLGALPPLSSGSGRRSTIIDTASAPVTATNVSTSILSENASSTANYGENCVDGSSSSSAAAEYYGYGGALEDGGQSGFVITEGGDGDPSTCIQGNYENYESYASVGQFGNNWFDGPVTAMPGMTKTPFKRGRNEVPTNIVEVKQDELMKNRPREDQVKLNGIAFGPSYQPASTKGKPTKLHKRKHQIGSLYFDMKQKEMELSDRRAKGFLTKAETQAKYGW